MFKAIINGVCYGITGGFIISVLSSKLYGSSIYNPAIIEWVKKFPNQLDAIFFSMLIWAVTGVLFTLSFQIFKNQSLTFLQAFFYHFLVTFPLLTILSIFAGWFPLKTTIILEFFIYMVIFYLFIWIIFYLLTKKSLRIHKNQ